MFLILLMAGSAFLGFYYCSKAGVKPGGKTANSEKELKKVRKADIQYYTTNKAGGGTTTYYWDLNAKVGGKKYIISKDEIAMSIFKTLDFDEDGYEDALILTAPCFMGNACTDSYMFCSYSKDGKFTLSEEFGENASKPIIEKWNGKNSVKIESQSLVSMDVRTERYILKNGKAVRVESKKKVPMKTIAQMMSDDLANTDPDIGKKLYYDLNGDGAKDYIHGTYWDRWNLIGDWRIVFSNGKKYKGESSIRRVGILPTKTNGVHDLVLDYDEVMIWDGKKYKEKKK